MVAMRKLLLVEDDKELIKSLVDWLQSDYEIESVSFGNDALQLLEGFSFDVVVLDWSLPDITGLDVCKKYRAVGGKIPILFLTGRTDIEYRETGLDSGADDYLTKPFELRELSARLRSLLRRPHELSTTFLTVRGVTLEVETRTLTLDSTKIRLTPKECAILEFLIRHPNRAYSSKNLLDKLWPLDTEASDETVRTTMKTLRHKLGKIGRLDIVTTMLGSGYICEQ